MNKTNIEWCDYTWNPVSGCLHDCPYCYARLNARRFSGDVRLNMKNKNIRKVGDNLYEIDEKVVSNNGATVNYPCEFAPTLHLYRFSKPSNLKTGANVFVCSMADLFGEWVPEEWIRRVFDTCLENPNHNYLFLTKNPKRYAELVESGVILRRPNMWYGYSYTDTSKTLYCKSKSNEFDGFKSFVSIEPLLEDVGAELNRRAKTPIADWVIIGAETGNRHGKVVPKKEWVENIVAHCDKFNIPVFMKDSLIDIVGEENMRREHPQELLTTRLSDKRKEVMETHCGRCRQNRRKSDMTAVILKKGRRGKAETVGYVCDDCLPNFLKGFENNAFNRKGSTGAGNPGTDKKE